MLERVFGDRVFGARVALGVMGAAMLVALARQGYIVGQWLAAHR